MRKGVAVESTKKKGHSRMSEIQIYNSSEFRQMIKHKHLKSIFDTKKNMQSSFT